MSTGRKNYNLSLVYTIKLITVFLVISAIVCTLTACTSSYHTFNTTGSEALAADELRHNVLENMAGVNTYRFNMNMGTRISMQDDTGIDQESVIQGDLDKPNRKMRMSLTMSQKIGPDRVPGASAKSDIYVAGDDMYVKSGGLGMPEDWQKQLTPQGFWQDQDIVAQQAEMLETDGFEITGMEEFQGAGCYVLEITPDMDIVWNTVKKQWDLHEMYSDIDPQEMVRDIYMLVWIAEDTFLPVRVQERLTLLADLSEMGGASVSGSSKADLEINMDLTVSDYNRDVNIVLPSEIEES
ncbi:MAG: hypothetical protein JXA46_16350 [Dehalococcoidales bacterium]|nr:hypothetical protein [Dehalococcoidales bacterium]